MNYKIFKKDRSLCLTPAQKMSFHENLLFEKGTYTGEVECGPCKFHTVAIFNEIEKNQYNVSVSIKNKGSDSCPIKEYEGPAQVQACRYLVINSGTCMDSAFFARGNL
ncbi:hypothetical protein Lsai_2383 [Legionella sainthelensi]|uniref:Uncharacterized protein n=1 Tax=Legionella sainthelensi TaxID=28087 RepID=A0A0W0YFU1_9GAMM|nr:hypothetical protein [Legionella sainthelensi]KTD55524.1 hypothetical protein Lsai_2383 [Legionella sainthelensi]